MPEPGFTGTDLFTYRLQAGSTVAGPVQVTIVVGDPHDLAERSNPVNANTAASSNGNNASNSSSNAARRQSRRSTVPPPSTGTEDEESDIERGSISTSRSKQKGGSSEPSSSGRRSNDIEMASISPSRKSPGRANRQASIGTTIHGEGKRGGNRASE